MPIKGYTDLLLNGSLGMLTDGQYEGVEIINRSAQRLEALINQLIQFASSVKGKLMANPTILHVPDLVEPVWDYFQPKADAAGVRRVREVPASLPLARADAEKIYWVLYPLLDHAIKFTPAGRRAILAAQVGTDLMRLSVRDTGIGIRPEKLSLIFEPFSHAADGSGQWVDGSGRGLALVKRIVEAHDARVQVESRLGQGSLFAFELPLVHPPAE